MLSTEYRIWTIHITQINGTCGCNNCHRTPYAVYGNQGLECRIFVIFHTNVAYLSIVELTSKLCIKYPCIYMRILCKTFDAT